MDSWILSSDSLIRTAEMKSIVQKSYIVERWMHRCMVTLKKTARKKKWSITILLMSLWSFYIYIYIYITTSVTHELHETYNCVTFQFMKKHIFCYLQDANFFYQIRIGQEDCSWNSSFFIQWTEMLWQEEQCYLMKWKMWR